MTHSLPVRPSLAFLKQQAKSMLRAVRDGDAQVWSDMAQHLQRFQLPNDATPATRAEMIQSVKLADAQFVLARHYGFANWAELKRQVEDLQLDADNRDEQVAKLLRFCLDGELSRAERRVANHPSLAVANIWIASAFGELAAVCEALDRSPELLSAVGGPLQAPPLVYACATRLAAPDQPREPRLRALVQELLRRGANPNACWTSEEFRCPLSALYAACGINGNAAIARLLLEAGANPNDNESLYHSVEHESIECTALLLDHGATMSGTNALHNAIGQGNLAALRLFLDRGGNVNERIDAQQSMTLFNWAIECNQTREMLELLVERGADVRAASRDGLTPFRRALHGGHAVALDILQHLGVSEPVGPTEEFVSACMLGDEDSARRCLATEPSLVDAVQGRGAELLNHAAWRGSLAAVQTMLSLGFPLVQPGRHDTTALHSACWKGFEAIVTLLLRHAAPLDVIESRFQCTPLEWALHGSVHCWQCEAESSQANRARAYGRIVTQLIAAGSPQPVDRLVRICQGPVEEALAEAGIVAADDIT